MFIFHQNYKLWPLVELPSQDRSDEWSHKGVWKKNIWEKSRKYFRCALYLEISLCFCFCIPYVVQIWLLMIRFWHFKIFFFIKTDHLWELPSQDGSDEWSQYGVYPRFMGPCAKSDRTCSFSARGIGNISSKALDIYQFLSRWTNMFYPLLGIWFGIARVAFLDCVIS